MEKESRDQMLFSALSTLEGSTAIASAIGEKLEKDIRNDEVEIEWGNFIETNLSISETAIADKKKIRFDAGKALDEIYDRLKKSLSKQLADIFDKFDVTSAQCSIRVFPTNKLKDQKTGFLAIINIEKV